MTYLPPFESFINPINPENSIIIYRDDEYHDTMTEKVDTDASQLITEIKPSPQRFWLYNICNKGPRRKCLSESTDNFSDFVYKDPIKTISETERVVRLRKTEANNTTPNLSTFISIRNKINKCTKNYKEKAQEQEKMSPKIRNILASKICRLKKKAYHESLKIKYAALGIEHREVTELLNHYQDLARNRNGVIDKELHKIQADIHITKAAGRLDNFIDEVLNLLDQSLYTNRVIAKLSSYKSEENICKQEYEDDQLSTYDIDSEHFIIEQEDMDFLYSDESFKDILNSSGSTSFTDDIYSLPVM